MPKRKTHDEYLEALFEKEIDFEPLEEYKGSAVKILHRCIEGHEWFVSPNSILRGSGCPVCSGNKKKTTEDYARNLKQKGSPYKPLEPYINAHTKILHECAEGHKWTVNPTYILAGGGCPVCSGNKKKTTDEYAAALEYRGIQHKPLEPYINTHTKILHECKKGHKWLATPNKILRGAGCPTCAVNGFSPEKPAILYYLKVDDYYKIGITNRTVEQRFTAKDRQKITVLFEKYYGQGQDAYEQEQAILKEFADHRVHIPGLLESHGNTELFTEDVLQLDNKKGP